MLSAVEAPSAAVWLSAAELSALSVEVELSEVLLSFPAHAVRDSSMDAARITDRNFFILFLLCSRAVRRSPCPTL